jgi:glycerol kinase
VVWDRRRQAGHNAIVCRIGARPPVQELVAAGHGEAVQKKTGLLIDPYFSGTKVAWLLDHVAGARDAAEAGKLAFGTIDSFLLWRLTGGKVHATDATNASRTMLFNIHEQKWDEECWRCWGFRRRCCRGEGQRGGFRVTDRSCSGRRCRWRGWRGSAGGAGRAGRRAGMIKHLRDRVLRGAEHRRRR